MSRVFCSRLARDLERFLEFKRALGLKYIRNEFALRLFDRHVAANAPRRGRLPIEQLLRGWLAGYEGRKARTIASQLSMVRAFLRYLSRTDPSTFVPGRDWGPYFTHTRFVPRLLSPADVRSLLRATDALRGPRWRRRTFRMLVLVVYCTGLRFGEAVRLTLNDVDFEQQVLTIRQSKGKTRLVPFRRDLAKELERYDAARPAASRTHDPAAFLTQPNGRPYTLVGAAEVIRELLRKTGLKPSRGRLGARPFDLRHSFAVQRLTNWYRSGVDLDAKLPLLSAYMGHDNLLGTEHYLRATPELLAAASRRFAARARRDSG